MQTTIKRILVPLEPSDYTQASSFRSAEIASRAGAQVTGLTVVDVKGIEDEVALPMRADLRVYPNPRSLELLEYSKEELEAVRSKFESGCSEHGVSSRSLSLSGSPASRIIGESRFHDLVVMGAKTNFHFATDEHSNDTLERVIDMLPIPLLLVPGGDGKPIEKVTVAYDGSLPATRALHHFIPFAKLWSPEIQLVGAELNHSSGERLMEEAIGLLAAHGIDRVESLLLEEEIDEVFEQGFFAESDLIVAGASSKSVLTEFFVGSFMKKLLREAECNLFVCS